MHAAAVRFDLHVPTSRSLKAKRAAIRPVVEGLRHKYRLSVAEVDHHDQWQRAAIAVAVVAGSDHQLRELIESARRFVDTRPDVELLVAETSYLETGSLEASYADVGSWDAAESAVDELGAEEAEADR